MNLEELARVAHSLGEVVGLGLRNLAHCPVEMNLMPESTLRWQAFNQRKPYLIATVFSLVVVAFAVGFLFEKLANAKEAAIADLEQKLTPIQAKTDSFTKAYARLQSTQKEADQISAWMEERYYWGDILQQMREALIRSEADIKKKLSAQRPGVEAGVWIEQFISTPDLGGASTQQGGQNPGPQPRQPQPGLAPEQTAAGNTNGVINLVCRAVSLTSVDPSANSEIAFEVERELRSATNYFDPKLTSLTQQMPTEDANGTFTFGLTVVLVNPLQL